MAPSEFPPGAVASTVQVIGRSLKLVRPVDPDRLLDDPAVRARNQRDDYMPYWAYLWPASYPLAEAVARHWGEAPAPPPEMLELGCGLGLAGLAALSLGYRVCFSDHDAQALEFVQRSARENAFPADRFSTLQLDWRNPPDLRFDRIIAADVLYEARLVPLVADVLARLLAPGGEALIATPPRASAESFPAALASAGLTHRAEAVIQRGTVYRVNQPAGERGA